MQESWHGNKNVSIDTLMASRHTVIRKNYMYSIMTLSTFMQFAVAVGLNFGALAGILKAYMFVLTR